MLYDYDTTTDDVIRLRTMWHDYDTTTYDVVRQWYDHVRCGRIAYNVIRLWYDHIRCDTIAFDVIRPRRCDTITCDVIRLWNEQLTMWCDYGDVTVDCSTTLARLGNDTNATTLEIACPKLNAVIEERWWNRRAWNILIPRFPTFFLVCSEEEDSLWIELFQY